MSSQERPSSSVSQFDGAAMGSQTYLHGKKAGKTSTKHESIPRRIVNALWATRQTRDTQNDSELLIKTTLKELIIYIVFLVVICISKLKAYKKNSIKKPFYYVIYLYMHVFFFNIIKSHSV